MIWQKSELTPSLDYQPWAFMIFVERNNTQFFSMLKSFTQSRGSPPYDTCVHPIQNLNHTYKKTFNPVFKVQSSKFKVQSSKFKVQSSKFKVQISKFKVQSSKFKVVCTDFGARSKVLIMVFLA
jgi:hypothetical protein